MNKSTKVSEFGKAALALDREFLQMQRLSRELESLSNLSGKGMERAQTLLVEVDICRGRLSVHMQAMVQTLENARCLNEKAETIIIERATMVHERQKEAEMLVERFKALADMVKHITEANLKFQHLKANALSHEDRAALNSHLPQINEQLGVLVEEAERLMHDSRKAQVKTLERNSDSLRQSLQNLRKRLSSVTDHPSY